MRYNYVIVAALVVVAALIALYYVLPTSQGTSTMSSTPSQNTATKDGMGPGQGGPSGGPGRGPSGGPGQGGGPGGPGEGMGPAMGCGERPPGQYINELFANHDKFIASYKVYPDNMKLIWTIRLKQGADPALLNLLKEHIEQMECILARGGNPRAHDPAFQAEAKLAKYIHTKAYIKGDALIVEKWADNPCAFDVVQAHAKIVKGFFEIGREEAMRTHEFGSPNCSSYGFPSP